MTRSEVTFDQWQACVDDGACAGGRDDHGWGRGDRPVVNVTFADAQAFASWLGTRLGLSCRLPTEAEWERAAAGGTTTAYWWGDATGVGMASCRDCAPVPRHSTARAGSFPANPYGLVDMNGNVWEWTGDCRDASCAERVVKGGSWYHTAANATTRARSYHPAASGSYTVGIRVVCLGRIFPPPPP